jgi:hypothetical protein
MDMSFAALSNSFASHEPSGYQSDRYDKIRGEGLGFALRLVEHCPPSRELTLAIRNIEQAVMWANKAIAINEVNLLPEEGDSE